MRILLMICTLMGSSFFISDKAFADQVGTGVFINSVGDVLTNRHVIENCGFIQVRLPNKEWRNAEISLVSSSFDLAILKTDWATDVFASLSVTEDDYPIIPTPGDDIFTYGYSYEKAGMEGWGRVGLVLPLENFLDLEYSKIQMDVGPGSSGSAIFDRTNLLVGILTRGKGTQRIFKDSLDEYFGATDIYALNGNAIAQFINEGGSKFSTWQADGWFMPHEVIRHAVEVTVLVACL